MDTATTVMSSWNAPNDIHDGDNTPNDTSVYLTISSVETADSGAYICSATVTDSSDSRYVVDSQPVTDTVIITVSKSLYREWEEVDVRSGEYVNVFSDLLLFHRIEYIYNIYSINITVSFSSLHTSHAGEYTCQWTLFTPAEGGKTVTNSSTPLTVTVRCKWCGRSLCSDGM